MSARQTREEQGRCRAIARHVAGESPSTICASLRHTRKWFYTWWERYQTGAPEWFRARSHRPVSSPRATSPEMTAQVVATRHALEADGLFAGAQAIHWELDERGIAVPSVRTIGRILARTGVSRRRRGRYEPTGKHYPGPGADGPGAVHQSDFVGPRYLVGPVRFYSLNSVDLATGRGAVQPLLQRDAQETIAAFWATWGRLGMPRHQQVDNEVVFYGGPLHPRALGPLIRLCLHHEIELWFIPPGEPWRNGVVEKFNDHWKDKFFRREHLAHVEALDSASLRFEEHHNGRYRYSKLGGRTPQQALRASGTPLRFPLSPVPPLHPLPRPDHGRYHLIRFIRGDRQFHIFGEPFVAPPAATYEYVRLTVDVAQQRLSIHLDGRIIEEYPYLLR